ncbi:MAG: ABC transporter permease, partial [Candidatus Limnocylindrales bacterium]
IIRRVLGAIPVLFIISLLIYGILLAAPGGPEQRFLQNPKITPDQIEAFKKRWGLDQPIPIQYCRWLGVCNPDGSGLGIFISNNGVPNLLPGFIGGGENGILHGDFGFSIQNGQPVTEIIGERIGPTIILAGTAWVLWLICAFLLGVMAAVKRYSTFDTGFTILTYVGYAMPTFLLGLLLIFFFTQPPLKIFPVGGMWDVRTIPSFGTSAYWQMLAQQPLKVLGDLAMHLVLPVITLMVVNVAGDSRFIRASMLDALDQDFIKTAKAKGVSNRGVTYHHALRNALLPAITNIGLEVPFLFAGAIVTETVFSWPGMGRLSIEATRNFDYPVLMGVLIVTAIIVVAANILADLAYAVVDPRVKYD